MVKIPAWAKNIWETVILMEPLSAATASPFNKKFLIENFFTN